MLRARKTLDPALTARDKKEKEEKEKKGEKLGSKLKRRNGRGLRRKQHCAISFGGNVGDHMARRFRGRRLRALDQASSQPT